MWWLPYRQKKQQSSCGGKAPGIRRHCLTDSPDAFDFAVANTAGQCCPAASIHSSGREYHEPEGMPIGMRRASSRRRRLNSSKEEPASALAIGQERAGGERG
jgi:hypothetical protein